MRLWHLKLVWFPVGVLLIVLGTGTLLKAMEEARSCRAVIEAIEKTGQRAPSALHACVRNAEDAQIVSAVAIEGGACLVAVSGVLLIGRGRGRSR